MAEPTRSCPRCQRVVLESKLVDEACPVCVAAAMPRPNPTPGKWPPINLGLLSLFCDPVMITSVFAVMRAREWLSYAAARDEMGEYSPWHAEIRSNAIWTLVLALIRPSFLVLAFVAIAFLRLSTPDAVVDAEPVIELDEHAEIMAMVRSDDVFVRRLGVCQLSETAPLPADRADVEQAIEDNALARGCGELALARIDQVPIPERFAELPAVVRSEVLSELIDRDLALGVDLLGLERTLDPVATDGISYFDEVFEPSVAIALLELGAHEPAREIALQTLATICIQDVALKAVVAEHGETHPALVELIPAGCEAKQ